MCWYWPLRGGALTRCFGTWCGTQRVKRERWKSTCLEALGNAGRPRSFSKIASYVADPATPLLLRDSAAHAMRHIETHEAERALTALAARSFYRSAPFL